MPGGLREFWPATGEKSGKEEQRGSTLPLTLSPKINSPSLFRRSFVCSFVRPFVQTVTIAVARSRDRFFI